MVFSLRSALVAVILPLSDLVCLLLDFLAFVARSSSLESELLLDELDPDGLSLLDMSRLTFQLELSSDGSSS